MFEIYYKNIHSLKILKSNHERNIRGLKTCMNYFRLKKSRYAVLLFLFTFTEQL